VKFKCGFVHK